MAIGPKSKGRSSTAKPYQSKKAVPIPNLPKVLRIGIIQSGKILEERIIRKRDTVTVGNSEKSTFIIVSRDLPARFEMFENKKAEDYTLQFTESMGGRISLDGEVRNLDELRDSGVAQKKGKIYQIGLSEQARGKIVVGDSTVLFQFVTQPPLQPRPQLPAAVRGGLFKNLEWFVTTLYICSFLIWVGVLSWLEMSDWPKPTEAEKYLQLQELIAAPEATFRTQTDKDLEDGEGDEKAEEEKEKKAVKKAAQKKDTGVGRDERPKKSAEQIAQERAQRRAAIAEQLARRGINKILGSLGGSGDGVIVDVLRGGDVGADQDDLLSQVKGVGVATGGDSALRGPAGGKGTGEVADISQLRMTGGDVAVKTAGAGKERKVTGKVRKKKPTAVDGTGDLSPQEVAKVVNRRIGAIKGCYERALRRNPNLEGKITVRFTISGSGKVSTARTTLNELSPEVGNCIVSAFKRFRFPQPDGGALTVEYPFLFTPSN
ncbi:MAG: energy transducer TonB [Proteobacteria bacterium]|nr:energy transducer TonB [Pseudomonadota bacterium]